MVVDLPQPDGPTNATYAPGLMSRSNELRTGTSDLVGYLKWTFSNLIWPSTSFKCLPSLLSLSTSISASVLSKVKILIAPPLAPEISGTNVKTLPAY